MNYMVLFVCLIFSIELKAEWVMEKNAALDLCNEYLAYLNRKPVDYYFQGMKPDPEFKDLAFPKMTPVYFEDFQHIIKRMLSLSTSPRKRTWEETVESLNLGKAKYFVYTADVNHDLVEENLFSYSVSSYSGLYRAYIGFILNENNNVLDLGENPLYMHKNRFTGHPFYYRGRFYTASILDFYIGLYEPSLPWKREVGINSGSAICTYDTKEFLEKGVKK